MTTLRVLSLATTLLLLITAAAFATEEHKQSRSVTKPSASFSRIIGAVSNWTRKEWLAAKATWSKEKLKWAGCERRAASKKLSGRANWFFLYDCMTK